MDINIQGSKADILFPSEEIKLDQRSTLCDRLIKVGNVFTKYTAILTASIASIVAIKGSTQLLLNYIAPTPLGAALIAISSVAIGAVSFTTASICAAYIEINLNPAMSKPASFSSLIEIPFTKFLIMAGSGYAALEALIAYRHKFGE